MNAPTKFLFEHSFDPPAGESTRTKKPVPTYLAEDLARARSEGFAEGERAGRLAAEQSTEQSVCRTIEAISSQWQALSQAQAGAWERQARDAVSAAITIVRKLFPKLTRRYGLAEIEAMLADALERLREEPRIVIRVADSALDPVQARVGALATRVGYEGRVVFLSQEGMQPGDVRIEWADGGAERDSERLWQDIDGLTARALATMAGPAAEAARQGAPVASDSRMETSPSGPG